jgi:hypothetical protein
VLASLLVLANPPATVLDSELTLVLAQRAVAFEIRHDEANGILCGCAPRGRAGGGTRRGGAARGPASRRRGIWGWGSGAASAIDARALDFLGRSAPVTSLDHAAAAARDVHDERAWRFAYDVVDVAPEQAPDAELQRRKQTPGRQVMAPA